MTDYDERIRRLQRLADELARLERERQRLTEAERQVTITVVNARELGASWGQIGAAMGVTRQAAQKRFKGWRWDAHTDQLWQEVALPATTASPSLSKSNSSRSR